MNNKKIVDRINGTRHFASLSYENALRYLNAVFELNLGVGSEDFVEVKENLLYVLKVVMTKDLGLDLDQISYRIKALNVDTAAQVEDNLGDFKFKISVNTQFFNEARIDKFIFSLFHEYGHIQQIIDERNGRNVPYAIGIIDEKFNKLTKWQKRGVIYKYFANKNELDANNFAYNKMFQFYKRSVRQYGNNKFKNETRKFLIGQYLTRNLRYYTGNTKYSGWKLITKLIKQQEDAATTSDPVSATVADKVYERNVNAGKDWISKDGVEEMIESIRNTQDFEILPISSRETFLMTLANMRAIKLALDMELDTDMLGIARIDDFRQPVKFVKADKRAINCPILGFFALNTKALQKIRTISSFEKELDKEIKKAEKNLKSDLLELSEM